MAEPNLFVSEDDIARARAEAIRERIEELRRAVERAQIAVATERPSEGRAS